MKNQPLKKNISLNAYKNHTQQPLSIAILKTDSPILRSSRTKCLLPEKPHPFVESVPITKMVNKKIASMMSPLDHTHHYFKLLTNGKKPYTQHYGQQHSRIILISEAPFQQNLNKEKGSERINYPIPTTAPQCPNSPEPNLKPASIISTH